MAGKARWEEVGIEDGVMDVRLASWKWFHTYVTQQMLDFTHYVWRGQRDADWPLQSTLDRQLRSLSDAARLDEAVQHLLRFQLSARGRRGPNPVRIEEDNEWWALGQHHGLATPLLDWTSSPFVALYFAFEKPERPPGGLRSVWAVGAFEAKNAQLRKASPGGGAPTLDLIHPHSDENARLVAQGGLFTRAPLGMTVDEWVRSNFSGEDKGARLLRLTVPEKGRTDCLRALNRMNISHLSLFPDLYGSGAYCNKALQIAKY